MFRLGLDIGLENLLSVLSSVSCSITNLTQALWFAANFSLYSGCTATPSRPSSSSSSVYCRLSLVDPARASTARHAAANNFR